MSAVKLDVLLTGEVWLPKAYVSRPGGRNPLAYGAAVLRGMRTPCLAFLLRHPSAGPVLVDTGLRRGTFDERLRDAGIEHEDVRCVVMTHLHLDHTSGMRLLPGADFVCSREEWRAATGPSAPLGGYAPGHLPPASRVRLVDFAARGEPHGPFRRTVDLLGDGSVRLVSTPGHTRGHLSVLIRVAGRGQVLLVGDAVYTVGGIADGRLPLLTADAAAYRRSLRELAAFARAEPDTPLVPSHDPKAWRELVPQAAPTGTAGSRSAARSARTARAARSPERTAPSM